jgi:hypothetical protein
MSLPVRIQGNNVIRVQIRICPAKIAAIALLLYCPLGFANWPFASPDPRIGYAEDHLLIKFRPSHVATFATLHRTNVLADLTRELNDSSVEVVDAFPENGAQGGKPDFHRFKFLKLKSGTKPHEVIKRLTGHPLVEYIELDHVALAEPHRTIPITPRNGICRKSRRPMSGTLRPDLPTSLSQCSTPD